MDTSVEIMQLIFDLKIKFHDSFYYVLGNHDYLSGRFIKGGVKQGLEYKTKLKECFGEEYIQLYQEFLMCSPIMMVAKGLVATHGGPASMIKGLDDILEVNPINESHPINESLQWGRYLTSYGDENVKEFLSAIEQDEAFFVVGHSPSLLPKDDFKAELMPKHYIIYAAGNKPGYASYRNGEMGFFGIEL